MKKAIIILTGLLCLGASTSFSQTKWSEADRQYLLENLKKTAAELQKETANLSAAQWNFKESPDRWSIKEVVEHIATWELLLTHEVSRALRGGEQPDLAKEAKPDSVHGAFIVEEKQHIATDYTKPFTYTVPMGLNDGKNNLAWFMKMRNESIDWLATAKEDMRLYFLKAGRGNIHQVYITIFGHTERHLRQIRKIKTHANYPKK